MAVAPRLQCPRCGHALRVSPDGFQPLPPCSQCGLAFDTHGGILRLNHGSSAGRSDYPAEVYDIVAAAEERHFWFAARRHVILSALRNAGVALAGRTLLEIGCGTGFMLRAFEQAGAQAWGIDMHLAAVEGARSRVRGPLVWTSAASLPFFDDFDVVALLDVIEHVEHDRALLTDARRLLRAGGTIVVAVPAGPHLWTRYDELIGHKRRYDRVSLAAALTASGFRVSHLQYFNIVPALLQRVQRVFISRRGSDAGVVEIVRQSLRIPPAPINAGLRLIMEAEAPLGTLSIARGGSLLAVAQRAR
jgi:2-polyprenyl-3-methyl-5-hydroxy-6-metoxy-1,4-benzoquinol methylase